MYHDQYAATTAQIRPFTIWQIANPDDDICNSLSPHSEVTAEYLTQLLTISADHNLRMQVDNIPQEIGWWSRLDAQAERVQEYLERRYAVWKAEQRRATEGEVLEHTGKRPTKDQLADLYRVHKDYGKINRWLEEVRESKRCVAGVVIALRAKAKRMDADVYRAPDGSLARRTA